VRRDKGDYTPPKGKIDPSIDMKTPPPVQVETMDAATFFGLFAKLLTDNPPQPWRDNDLEYRTGLVRDAKHPTHKEGNHRRFKYTVEGWAIVQSQPKSSNYIFPYDPKTVGAAFAGACHVLGIENLHFHDLPHEATSRQFERGYQIHEVAQFTLPDSWNELKRYANLKPDSVHDLSDDRKASAAAGSLERTSRPINPPSHAAGRLARRDPRAHEPRGFLPAESERLARQRFCRRSRPRFLIAQAEVFWRHAIQRNIGLPIKLCE
jgi:hypothetical protein